MPARGLTIRDILASPKEKADLLTQAAKRYAASENYYRPRFEKGIECWEIYRAIEEAADDSDETTTGPGYAYGIIEDSVASMSESILNMGVPTPARHRKAEHKEKAQKFNGMAASYFSNGDYQEKYPNSVRERMVVGWNWEVDSWAWQYRKGKRWAMVESVDEVTGAVSKAMQEIEEDTPVKVGYFTRFPSAFNIFPQPRIESQDKMKWLIEIEERVALSDMREMQYVDPTTKKLVPFFDLTEVMADKERGVAIRPEEVSKDVSDHRQELREITDGTSNSTGDETADDIDQITLKWVWEADLLYCIGNGKYIVAYIENLFHRPGIPHRLKVCTPQPHSLLGLGMIEPAIPLFHQLDDIHILSMRNWERIINRMIAYNPDSVPYATNDLKPSAQGRIRIRPQLGNSIQGEIMSFEQSDPTPSMLNQESNCKGLLEHKLGRADFTAPTAGTQKTHDTLGGLNKIEAQVQKRVAAMLRQELAGFQKQMWRMEGMYLQFLTQKMPFSVYGPDGSTVMMEMDLWDIDTEGAGFDFVLEFDPSLGDDALMRNQKMVLIEQGIKYNEAIMAQFPPGTKALAQLDEIMADAFKAFGYRDTSKVLVRPDGVLAPDAELQLMMQGQPVQVNPLEDLVGHYADHIRQSQDPQLLEGIQRGAIPPDVLVRLYAHIEQTGGAIQQALRDPMVIIRMKEFAKQGAGLGGGPAMGNSPTRSNPREGVADVSPRTPSA